MLQLVNEIFWLYMLYSFFSSTFLSRNSFLCNAAEGPRNCTSVQYLGTLQMHVPLKPHQKQVNTTWDTWKHTHTQITRPSEGLMLVRWTSSRWADWDTSGSDDTQTMCSHTSDRVLHYRGRKNRSNNTENVYETRSLAGTWIWKQKNKLE